MAIQQMTPAEQRAPASGASGAAMGVLRRVVGAREVIIAFVVVALMVYLSFATRTFWSQDNLMVLGRQIALVALIAVGMTFVIIMGGIDLSVGSVVALASVMTGVALVWWDLPLIPGVLVGLATGLAAGFVNGFLHIKTGVAPFIITLGMMGFARGLALVITRGPTISGLPSDYLVLGQGLAFKSEGFVGIPIPVIVAAVVALLAHIFLSRTAMGRHVYFIGSNEEAARLSGINVNKLKVIIYTTCSGLAAMSAVIETSRMSTAQPASGQGYELTAIASVIIGGASLNGGEGTVLGTVLGATLLGLITNGLIHLKIESYWQQVFVGAIIVIAVALDTWRHRRG